MIPDKYKKWFVILLLVLACVLCLWTLFSSGSDSNLAPVKKVAERQLYESQRTERMIRAIDERKEAEQNALKKEVVSDDNVIATLDRLLSGK